MRRVVEGIVLRETITRETDKMLTVLTKSEGKLAVVARGARRKRSRIAAAAQPLVYSEMTLFQRGKWCIMEEASTIALFSGLQTDLSAFALASYFAEMAEQLTAEDEPAPEVLALLLNALYALSDRRLAPAKVKPAFELRLLQLSGFAPLLDGCGVCGRTMPQEPMLDIVRGLLHCKSCSLNAPHGLSMPLCPASLQAMRYLLSCPPKKLYAFSLPAAPLCRLSDTVEAFAAAQLERGFRTLDFYKSLEPSGAETEPITPRDNAGKGWEHDVNLER